MCFSHHLLGLVRERIPLGMIFNLCFTILPPMLEIGILNCIPNSDSRHQNLQHIEVPFGQIEARFPKPNWPLSTKKTGSVCWECNGSGLKQMVVSVNWGAQYRPLVYPKLRPQIFRCINLSGPFGFRGGRI